MLSLRVYTRRILSHISWPLFFGLLAGVLDEGIQMFADGRGSDVRDVVIDFSGVVFGPVSYTHLYILRGAGKRQLALADMWETKYGHAGEEETSQIMAITPEGVVKLEQQVYEEPILPRMDLTQQVPGVHSGLWWYAKRCV